MYHYIYHHQLQQSKYQKKLVRLENIIQKMGLSGQTERLHKLSHLPDIISRVFSRAQPPNTLVVIGDSALFSQIISSLTKANKDPVVAYVPFFQKDNLAHNLGFTDIETALSALSARIIRGFDLGKIGTSNFFTDYLKISTANVLLSIDKKYTVSLKETVVKIDIYNLKNSDLSPLYNNQINPQDGQLNIILRVQKKSTFKTALFVDGYFICKNLKIKSLKSGEVGVEADNYQSLKTPLTISVAKQKIQLVVGKQRLIP